MASGILGSLRRGMSGLLRSYHARPHTKFPTGPNLAARKAPRVREPLDHSGFACRYSPSYPPDLNPIEPAWARVKAELRRAAARDEEALHRALGPALDRVSADNAEAHFRHCGYDRPD